MSVKCANCGSMNTQAGFDTHLCLVCAHTTHADGTESPPMQLAQTVDPNAGWIPTIEYPEPEGQHPDRRRRPGDEMTDEYTGPPVETVQGPANSTEPVAEPEPVSVPAPAVEFEPVVAPETEPPVA